MDVTGVSSAAVSQVGNTGEAVAITMQRKSQDMQRETAQSLIEALPDPMSPLGQNIDIKV